MVLLLVSMLCAEAELSWVSAEDCSGLEERGQIGISASYEIHNDTTIVTIDWKGCSENDMLVVNLDSRFQGYARSFLLNALAAQLFNLVLARSAGGAASATFSYKRSEFVDYMRDHELVLSVYLTQGVDIKYHAEDVSVEGKGRVIGPTELTSADCSEDFQILCGGRDSVVGRIFLPNLRVFAEQGTAGRRCGVNVPWQGVKGVLHLDIVQ